MIIFTYIYSNISKKLLMDCWSHEAKSIARLFERKKLWEILIRRMLVNLMAIRVTMPTNELSLWLIYWNKMDEQLPKNLLKIFCKFVKLNKHKNIIKSNLFNSTKKNFISYNLIWTLHLIFNNAERSLFLLHS